MRADLLPVCVRWDVDRAASTSSQGRTPGTVCSILQRPATKEVSRAAGHSVRGQLWGTVLIGHPGFLTACAGGSRLSLVGARQFDGGEGIYYSLIMVAHAIVITSMSKHSSKQA